MPHLQVERSIAESIAPFDAFGAANAQRFIDGVLVIRILDKRALDSGSRTELILGARIQVVGRRLKISRAELTVAADGVGVHTLNGGLLEHTTRGAEAASDAFLRVDLPDRSPCRATVRQHTYKPADAGHRRQTRAVAKKLPPGNCHWS
jgi:hypothetical protein